MIGKNWVRFGIILAVMLASLVLSYWGSMRILILVLALLGGVAGLLVLLKRINLGFILLLLAGMFIPFRGPGGINAAVLIAAAIIGLWLADMVVVKRSLYLIRSQTLLPVLIFLVVSVISFVMGQIPWFIFANQAPLDAQVGGWFIFIFSLGIMLAVAHLITDLKWLAWIVWVFIGFGALYVIGRSFQLPVDRLYQHGFAAGSMFWTWLTAFVFGQAVFNRNLKTSIKGLLFIILLFTLYTSIVQGYDWKSGWVPPLVVIAVLLGLRYPRLVILAIPVALIAVGYLAIRLIATEEYSFGTRVDAWKIVLEISRVNPLFGLGFSNYYWYTPLFPIRGWRVSFNSHSQYVDLIAQTGYLGLLCFLWIFFAVGRLSWDLSRRLKDGFARGYAYGVLAGIIGTLVAAFLVDWVLPFVYNIGLTGFRASILPWIFMGGLISVEQIYNSVGLNHRNDLRMERS